MKRFLLLLFLICWSGYGQTEILKTYITSDSLTYITLFRNGEASYISYQGTSPIKVQEWRKKKPPTRGCNSVYYVLKNRDYGKFVLSNDSLQLNFTDQDVKRIKIEKEMLQNSSFKDSIFICVAPANEVKNEISLNPWGFASEDQKISKNSFLFEDFATISFCLAKNQLPMKFLISNTDGFTIDSFLDYDIKIYLNDYKLYPVPDKPKMSFALNTLIEAP